MHSSKRNFVASVCGGILCGATLLGCGSSSKDSEGYTEIPSTFSICSGDLTTSRLSIDLHANIAKVCLDDNNDSAVIRVLRWQEDGAHSQDVIEGVSKRTIDGRTRSYTVTAPTSGGDTARYQLKLQEKFVIRNEGVLSLHFVGSLEVVQLAQDGEPIGPTQRLDDLHFYNETPEEDLHWGYEPPVDPPHWGSLLPEYELCEAGRTQSPIEIGRQNTVQPTLPELTFQYRPSWVSLVNNGHALQVNVPPGNSLTFQGKRYELLQFHVHVPSEHTINGERAPSEVHMVHQARDGTLAVVGFFGVTAAGPESASTPNPLFGLILDAFPAEENRPVEYPAAINPIEVLPKDQPRGYYTYSGSLTTPPCSEGVTWIVLKGVLNVSSDAIERTKTLIGSENARSIDGKPLPLNDRPVLETPF